MVTNREEQKIAMYQMRFTLEELVKKYMAGVCDDELYLEAGSLHDALHDFEQLLNLNNPKWIDERDNRIEIVGAESVATFNQLVKKSKLE
ncbi:hypothetical protein ACQKTA_09040 [Enterococcus sp. 22-H-5-01]|uniref:hypothetical protein n=1 Tax=Enterococcus sp. 22-H-5-01 TaxID=3418555 RepID=UPI003CFE82BE